MATMREIRTRIRTVKNIEKITRAMKLVAAARLKRAQGRVEAARPYAERMEQMMRRLSAAGAGGGGQPLVCGRPADRPDAPGHVRERPGGCRVRGLPAFPVGDGAGADCPAAPAA